ncbi:MAG: hypothetical protein RBU37_14990 [Myxococcota bacterium]|jgi:hypothetical protein|nr:hypothetical protein [Myxococcota bacterium]
MPQERALNEVFQRITVSKVSCSKAADIAFSLLKPSPWNLLRDDDWIGMRPAARRDVAFILLMTHVDSPLATPLLMPNPLPRFLSQELEQFSATPQEQLDDEQCAYELLPFLARLDGVPGGLKGLAALVPVEDVLFTLIALCRVETFHSRVSTLQTILGSFHPIVTASR